MRLGLYWLGSGIGSVPPYGQKFDVNFASLTAAAGLRWPVSEAISLEASAGFGLTLVWFGYADPTASAGAAYRNDSTWVGTPGGALALVYRLSQRWALAGEVRASWMVPGLVFVTDTAQVGGSYAPMISGTLALRVML
jgi:hypothetical protein